MRIAVTTILFALPAFAQQPDPVIETARAIAARDSQLLPSYIVRRTTARQVNTNDVSLKLPPSNPKDRNFPTNPRLSWRAEDSISAEVTDDAGREIYSEITRNDKSARELPASGVWSAGQFAGLLGEVLSPERVAVFTDPRTESIRGRPAWRYNFAVEAPHSGWQVHVNVPRSQGSGSISPAYIGAIWIDKATSGVLRIERAAHGLPDKYPLILAESATDYAPVKIGDESYLLPISSVTISCRLGRPNCFRNETTFQNYRKFEASTNISFEK